MKNLLISDPHFMDDENELYRLRLFEFVHDILNECEVHTISVLGDLCDAKDRHPGSLVNRVVAGLIGWSRKVSLNILRGNHDGYGRVSFFSFLGQFPGITYYDEPVETFIEGIPTLYLPHSRNPQEEWKDLELSGKLVFAHATVNEVVTESGFVLKECGLSSKMFDTTLATLSGDIHKPQTIGKITYVGSPYHTRFGDHFDGGVAVLDTQTMQLNRMYLPFPRRFMLDVTSLDNFVRQVKHLESEKVKHKVKIRYHVNQENSAGWSEERRKMLLWMEDHNFELADFDTIKEKVDPILMQVDTETHREVDLDRYVLDKQISERLAGVGKRLVDDWEKRNAGN